MKGMKIMMMRMMIRASLMGEKGEIGEAENNDATGFDFCGS